MTTKNEPSLEALEFDLHDELIDACREAKEKCKYNPTRFLQMLQNHGTVETVKRLLSTGDVAQTGLTELYLCKRLYLSVEAKVLIPKYKPLFSDDIRKTARRRLDDRNFDVDGFLANF